MKQKRQNRSESPVHWLPIDSRLIFPIFTFGHIRGIAKFFLAVEMIMAISVVFGSLVLFVIRLSMLK